MKTTSILLVVLLSLSLYSCNKDEDDDNDSPVSNVDKETLSSWSSTGNGLITARLDINGANLSGTPFTLVYKFPDTSEIQCPNSTLAGSEANGSYQTDTCVATDDSTADGSSMAISTTTAAVESTAVGGTYSNNGSILEICKSNGSCRDYE